MKRTAEALKAYDDGERARLHAWHEAENDADVQACIVADARALNEVRRAFAEDTKTVNSTERAMIATLDFMRECVERHQRGVGGGPRRFHR